MDKNKNLELWKMVDTTDPKYTKTVNKRGGFTAIGAQYQLKRATELFGPMGVGFGVRGENFTKYEDVGLVLYNAKFWYKYNGEEGTFPIQSSIRYNYNNRIDDDFAKKLATDALTKGLSKIGFNADVFMGMFDDNKYVNRLKKEFSKNGEPSADNDWLAKVRVAMDGLHDEDIVMVEEAIANGKVNVNNYNKTINRINELKAAKIDGDN